MKVLLPISLDRWRNPISTLLRACVRYNPDIEFHSFSNPVSDEDRREGGEFWKLPNLRLRRSADILKERFDIVHTASYSHQNYAASLAAKLRGFAHTRYLVTLNLEPTRAHPQTWQRYIRMMRFCDAFVAVSNAVAQDPRERFQERFLGVYPNGFDSAFYRTDRDYAADLPPELKDIPAGFPLWIGVVEKRKRPDVLLEVARRNEGMKFVVLGAEGGDGAEYAQLLRTQPNILWLGEQNRATARAVMAKAGVLLFPSDREGLSLAMIEALAMGLPVIAQPKSSMPELVKPGRNGELVDAAETDRWIEALQKWSRPLAAGLETVLEEERLEVVSRFSWERIGTSYGDVYKRTLEMPVKPIHL